MADTTPYTACGTHADGSFPARVLQRFHRNASGIAARAVMQKSAKEGFLDALVEVRHCLPRSCVCHRTTGLSPPCPAQNVRLILTQLVREPTAAELAPPPSPVASQVALPVPVAPVAALALRSVGAVGEAATPEQMSSLDYWRELAKPAREMEPPPRVGRAARAVSAPPPVTGAPAASSAPPTTELAVVPSTVRTRSAAAALVPPSRRRHVRPRPDSGDSLSSDTGTDAEGEVMASAGEGPVDAGPGGRLPPSLLAARVTRASRNRKCNRLSLGPVVATVDGTEFVCARGTVVFTDSAGSGGPQPAPE